MWAIIATALLASPTVAGAQDLDWSRQQRSRVQIAVRAVGTAHVGGIERKDVDGTADLGHGIGGELGIGAILGGWLVMELRAGYARLDVEQRAERRDLWAGVAMRAWLARRWALSPVLGGGLMFHRLSFDVNAIAPEIEGGLGLRVTDALSVIFGASAAPYIADRSPDLRLEGFVTFDFRI